MTEPKDLAGIVKFHRKRGGLSRIQLAELAGVGKTVIFNIEKGKVSVRFDILVKILNVLNITLRPESPLMSEFSNNQEENASHEKS